MTTGMGCSQGWGFKRSWVVSIKKDLLQFAESKTWEHKSVCTIFKVGPRKRDLNPKHFNHELISLGLYDRENPTDIVPKTKGDMFRLAMVSAFLLDLGKTANEWENICSQVVTEHPRTMRALYSEVGDDVPEEDVASVLTLDAIFLTCYLSCWHLPWFGPHFPSVISTYGKESFSTIGMLDEDVIKLENQIPLPLLRNVFAFALHCEKLKDISDIDKMVRDLCATVVGRSYHPYIPGFKSSAPQVTFNVNFDKCKHLLDCLYVAMCSQVRIENDVNETRIGAIQHDLNEIPNVRDCPKQPARSGEVGLQLSAVEQLTEVRPVQSTKLSGAGVVQPHLSIEVPPIQSTELFESTVIQPHLSTEVPPAQSTELFGSVTVQPQSKEVLPVQSTQRFVFESSVVQPYLSTDSDSDSDSEVQPLQATDRFVFGPAASTDQFAFAFGQTVIPQPPSGPMHSTVVRPEVMRESGSPDSKVQPVQATDRFELGPAASTDQLAFGPPVIPQPASRRMVSAVVRPQQLGQPAQLTMQSAVVRPQLLGQPVQSRMNLAVVQQPLLGEARDPVQSIVDSAVAQPHLSGKPDLIMDSVIVQPVQWATVPPQQSAPHNWNWCTCVTLLWPCYRGTIPPRVSDLNRRTVLPSATRLAEAGITFQGRQGQFGDVEFKVHMFLDKAILFLPIIESLGDDTERVWRNLVAYEDEQTTTSKFTHGEFKEYLELMDELIDTESDVAILKKGRHPVIVRNGLGSDEAVALLFNSILQESTNAPHPKWGELRREIYDFYSDERRQGRVEFMRTYFGKWWLTVSVLAAGFLLVLTVVQTLYALLSYY